MGRWQTKRLCTRGGDLHCDKSGKAKASVLGGQVIVVVRQGKEPLVGRCSYCWLGEELIARPIYRGGWFGIKQAGTVRAGSSSQDKQDEVKAMGRLWAVVLCHFGKFNLFLGKE